MDVQLTGPRNPLTGLDVQTRNRRRTVSRAAGSVRADGLPRVHHRVVRKAVRGSALRALRRLVGSRNVAVRSLVFGQARIGCEPLLEDLVLLIYVQLGCPVLCVQPAVPYVYAVGYAALRGIHQVERLGTLL